MTKKILAAVLGMSFAVGCGGGDSGSGVDGDKRYVQMSDSERKDFCEYIADVAGPPRTVTCDGQEREVGVEGTDAEIQGCVQDLAEEAPMIPNCAATVAQAEACIEALLGPECISAIPPECEPLFAETCTAGQ